MAEVLQINTFLERSGSLPVIDVRSPSEFIQGHIPGAINIPLFDDQERKEVGTLYKQVNREAAIFAGFEFIGKKLADLAREGVKKAGRQKTLLVHCWRGGMRSASMAWLFETAGLSCALLEGGYKSYRRHVREQLAAPVSLRVVGGKTGSGKTLILARLQELGEQVIDLEALAHHKGSAFGALGEPDQPTTEQFENDLSQVVSGLDPDRRVWIEDESRNIGKCVIPAELYDRMKEAETYFLDIPREERARYLVADYAAHDQEALKACIQKIHKRLGGDRAREATDAIDREDFFTSALITLQYYDKAYMYALRSNHARFRLIESRTVDPESNARLLLHGESNARQK